MEKNIENEMETWITSGFPLRTVTQHLPESRNAQATLKPLQVLCGKRALSRRVLPRDRLRRGQFFSLRLSQVNTVREPRKVITAPEG